MQIKVKIFILLILCILMSLANTNIYSNSQKSSGSNNNPQNLPDSLNKNLLVNGELISAFELKIILENLKIDTVKFKKWEKARIQWHKYKDNEINKQFLTLYLPKKRNIKDTVYIRTSKGKGHKIYYNEGLSQFYQLNGKEVDGIEIYFNDIETIEILKTNDAIRRFENKAKSGAIIVKTKNGVLTPDPEFSKTILINGKLETFSELITIYDDLHARVSSNKIDKNSCRVIDVVEIMAYETGIITRKIIVLSKSESCEGELYGYIIGNKENKRSFYFDDIEKIDILDSKETMDQFGQEAKIGSIVIKVKE